MSETDGQQIDLMDEVLLEAVHDDESADSGAQAVDEVSEQNFEGSELEGFEGADIAVVEFVSDDHLVSTIESLLFATDRPLSISALHQPFKGTNIKPGDVRRAVESLMADYANARRGVTLEEVSAGLQLRTKLDNMSFIKRSIKTRPFRLSQPALEVLSVIAYKQPCPKITVDEVRGVESGHLLRALMERGLVQFEGRSDLPGKPMLYSTTKKFLEIFGLRNIRELPSLHEIDELIPEGIGVEETKPKLSDMTESLSLAEESTYSQGEEELLKITSELEQISTQTEFFEQEKERQRRERDASRAQDIRERLVVGQSVEDKDIRWLEKYEAQLAAAMAVPAPEESGGQIDAVKPEALMQEAESSPRDVNDLAAMAARAAAEFDDESSDSRPPESHS